MAARPERRPGPPARLGRQSGARVLNLPLLSTPMPLPTLHPPAASGLLDAQALARLQELDPSGQAGLVTRVLATYTLSLERLLDQLRAARSAGDSDGMRHAAHTLKSSSASVGALELSALCAQAEVRLREGLRDGHADAALLDRLSAEGQRILDGLRTR
jgi:HPt (histidine-containing phosphotransfer) domain-containing protein